MEQELQSALGKRGEGVEPLGRELAAGSWKLASSPGFTCPRNPTQAVTHGEGRATAVS